MTRLSSCEELRLYRWGIRSDRCQYRGGYGWQYQELWIWIAGVFENEVVSVVR